MSSGPPPIVIAASRAQAREWAHDAGFVRHDDWYYVDPKDSNPIMCACGAEVVFLPGWASVRTLKEIERVVHYAMKAQRAPQDWIEHRQNAVAEHIRRRKAIANGDAEAQG